MLDRGLEVLCPQIEHNPLRWERQLVSEFAIREDGRAIGQGVGR